MKTTKAPLFAMMAAIFLHLNLLATDIFVSTTGNNTAGDGTIGNLFTTYPAYYRFDRPFTAIGWANEENLEGGTNDYWAKIRISNPEVGLHEPS